MASYTAGLPESYAALWLNRNVARFRGPLGDATRRFCRAGFIVEIEIAQKCLAVDRDQIEHEACGLTLRGIENDRFLNSHRL